MPHEQDPSNQDQPKTEETPDPSALANAAAMAHVKRFQEKTLPGLISGAIAEALKSFQPPAPAPKEEEETPKGKKVDPEVAALKQQLADIKAHAERQAAEAAAQIRKSHEDRARVDLKQGLVGAVKPELVDLLQGHLFNKVTFDQDGTPLFTVKQKTPYGDMDDVQMPLKDGLQNYLKSEEAKAYLPAPEAGKVPPARRQQAGTALPPNHQPPDLSTATEQQKLAYADAYEAELAQVLAGQAR